MMKTIILLVTITSISYGISFGKSAETYIKNGMAKWSSNDNSGAIADYNKAIKLDPKNVTAYFYRCLSKGNLQDYAGAMVDINKVIELDPKNTMGYSQRASLKGNLQELETAVEAISGGAEIQVTGLTTLADVDTFLVDDCQQLEWEVVVFEEATPANKQAFKMMDMHDGTAGSDAFNVDDTQF